MSFLGRIGKRIADTGGPGKALWHLFRVSKIPAGTFIGEDEHGNKYYEDHTQVFGAHRWVDYSASEYDASQIPAKWHAWMHKMTDDIPTNPQHEWQPTTAEYQPNLSGSKNEYVPYSTTVTKIESWKP
eukprot:m.111322 g.111322  ORF g.111322 m.111322 type:complete len:128 (-) comp12927_c0_seq1:4244-4627(-)